MAVVEADIPLGELIPGPQASGVYAPHITHLMEEIGTGVKLPPVKVVVLDGQKWLVDGTHRAYIEHLMGGEAIRARIAYSDEDVAELGADGVVGCRSLDDVRLVRDGVWLRELLKHDVVGLSDLPIRQERR